MFENWQPSIAELVLILSTGLGWGIPVGIPPRENAELTRVIPNSSFYFAHWSGTAEVQTDSENAAVRFWESEEIVRLRAEVRRECVDRFTRWESILEGPLALEGAQLLRKHGPIVLRSPTTCYLNEVVSRDGPHGASRLEAGLITELPPDTAATVKRDVELWQAHVADDPLWSIEIHPQEFQGIGGYTWRFGGERLPSMEWLVHNHHLVVGVGEGSVAALLDRWKGEDNPRVRKMREQAGHARITTLSSMDVPRLFHFLDDWLAPPARKWMTSLGMEELGEVSTVMALDSTGMMGLTSLRASSRGTLRERAGFQWFDQPPLTPADLEGVPADAVFAHVFRYDPSAVVEWFGRLTRFSEEGEFLAEQFWESLEMASGINPKEDLLNCLGSVGAVYYSAAEGGSPLGGATWILKVADPEKLKATIERLAAEGRENESSNSYGPRLHTLQVGAATIYTIQHRSGESPFAPSVCLQGNDLIFTSLPQNLRAHLRRRGKTPGLATRAEVQPLLRGKQRTIALGLMDDKAFLESTLPLAPLIVGRMIANSEIEGGSTFDVAAIPSGPLLELPTRLSVTDIQRHGDEITIHSRGNLPASGTLCSLPALAALGLPTAHLAYESHRRETSLSNLRTLCNATLAYQADKGHLPPLYLPTKQGGPGLSWRVALLPYLGQQQLFDAFHLDEPWDSPHNRPLVEGMPDVYRSTLGTTKSGMTNYLGVQGEKSVLVEPTAPIKLEEVTDGDGMTLLAVEANDELAVEWTRPMEYVWSAENPTAGLGGLLRHNAFHAVFLDADATPISLATDQEVIKAIYTRNGGEDVDYGDVLKP